MPIMYVFIMRWNQMRQACQAAGAEWPMDESVKATFEQFMETAKKNDVTRLNEWRDGFEPLEKAVEQSGK